MAFEEFHDLWELKDKNYRRLDLSKAAIVLMDGKDVTSDHVHYHLMSEHPIYRDMADYAYRIAEDAGLDCTIYGGIDELTVVFPNPQQIYDHFRVDDCADYILSLYTQRFLKLFWGKYPSVFLKTTMFNIPHEDISRFLSFRQAICNSGALWYQAKEHLDKNLYKGQDFNAEQMETLLREHGLYDNLMSHPDFYNGVLRHHKAQTMLQRYANAFSSL